MLGSCVLGVGGWKAACFIVPAPQVTLMTIRETTTYRNRFLSVAEAVQRTFKKNFHLIFVTEIPVFE